ncbi:MAG: GNAT family N-acetyltransferase [Clostridiales bacterium]|nr:GNAT family N-acetyltransferase [Clostridiales bacterium]
MSILKYKEKYESDLYKLYCKAHKIHFDEEKKNTEDKTFYSFNNFEIYLLSINKRLKGYVIFSKSYSFFGNNVIDIDDIFIEKDYCNYSNYCMLIESINKGFFRKKYKYCKLASRGKRDKKLVALFDLKPIKIMYEMQINLNNFKEIYMDDPKIITFKRGIDELKRAEVQNSIFSDSDEHVDCSVNDILYEEKQDFFIDDGCFFLNIDGITAGYSQIIIEKSSNPKPYIVNFGIVKKYRKQGHAKELLNHTLGIIKRKGFNNAYVMVNAGNIKAYNLYKGFGFHKVSTLCCYLFKY